MLLLQDYLIAEGYNGATARGDVVTFESKYYCSQDGTRCAELPAAVFCTCVWGYMYLTSATLTVPACGQCPKGLQQHSSSSPSYAHALQVGRLAQG